MKLHQGRVYNNGFSAAFPWELVCAVPLLIMAGLIAMEIPEFPGWPGVGVAAVAFAGLLGLVLLNLFSESRYHASEAALVIHLPMRSLHILYSNISRIDRVRREARGSTGGVWITFRRGTHTRTLKLMPECPEALVWDILQHCPHLTGNKNLRLVRNRSFKLVKNPYLLKAETQTEVW